MLNINRCGELTAQEREACSHYYASSVFLHACAQGWSGEFADSAKFQAFLVESPTLVNGLDEALKKFVVSSAGTVFAGHAKGFSVLGSLLFDSPDFYRNSVYCYPGYTSTSYIREIAEDRLSGGGRPVLLEFKLREGLNALPMDEATGQCGEFEVLLPRSAKFRVEDACSITIRGQHVLHLFLT